MLLSAHRLKYKGLISANNYTYNNQFRNKYHYSTHKISDSPHAFVLGTISIFYNYFSTVVACYD